MNSIRKIHKAFLGRRERKKEEAYFNDESRISCSGQSQNLLEWKSEGSRSDPLLINLKWILTRDSYKCDRIISYLESKMEDKQFIGLDIEWDPCFRKGQISRTALLQIGVHTGHCLLLQVNQISSLPQRLVKLLTDPTILKLGVGILEDIVKLNRDFSVRVQGAIDLRSIAPPSKRDGLAALTQEHLNTVLPKSKKLRMTKWSGQLTPDKQAYAAKDAYIAVLLVKKLVAKELRISEDKVSRNDVLTTKKNFAERRTGLNGFGRSKS